MHILISRTATGYNKLIIENDLAQINSTTSVEMK